MSGLLWVGGTIGSWSQTSDPWYVENTTSPFVYIAEPTAAYSVTADGTTGGALTLDLSGAGTADNLQMSTATLVLSSATLQLATASNLDVVQQTDGSVEFESGTNVIAGGLSQSVSGGAVSIDGTAELLLYGVNVLTGLFTGGGDLVIGGGSTATIEPTVTIDTGTFELGVNGDGFGAVAQLGGDLSYTGLFKDDNYSGNPASLDLAGFTLTLNGTAFFNGYFYGGGAVVLAGTDDINGFGAAGTISFSDTGTVTQDGAFNLVGALDIAAGATYDFTTDSSIVGTVNIAADNAGLLEKTGGTGTSTIEGSFSNTGLVDVTNGTLQVGGGGGAGGSISGTIEGSGAFVLSDGTYALASSIDLAVATLGLFGDFTALLQGDLSYAGTINASVYETTATINLGGHTLAFTDAGTLASAFGSLNVVGGGLVQVANSASIGMSELGFASGVTLENAGILSEGYALSLNENSGATNSALLNDATATLSVVDGTAVTSGSGPALLQNAGLLELTTGTGVASFTVPVDNTGTILAATGTMTFSGGGTLDGALTGAGAIDLDGGTYTLGANLAAAVANLGMFSPTELLLQGNLTYAGSLDASAYEADQTIDLGGHTLEFTQADTLSSAYAVLNVTGGGRMLVASGASVGLSELGFANGVTLENAGILSEGYVLTLNEDGGAAASVLLNDATGTLTVVDGTAITAGDGPATLQNAGLIELATGTSEASITVRVSNTGSVLAEAGTLQFTGPVANSGTMSAAGAALVISGALSGSGAIAISGGGEAGLYGAVQAGQVVAFEGADAGTLTLGTASFGGAVIGFATNDAIDLTGLGFVAGADATLLAGDTLQIVSGSATADLRLGGDYAGAVFQVGTDSGNGSLVTVNAAPCFRRGTHLLTESGAVAVEALAIGQRLVTAGGALRPISWIGHRSVAAARHPRPETVWPVRIAPHAFGRNRPERTLYLSPDHAVFDEGVLVPVRWLVNGSTVVQEPVAQEPVAQVEYFHVELDRHDVVLAEGLPAESYLDTCNRDGFDNGDRVRLHADFAAGQGAEAIFEAAACAPLRIAGEEVDRLTARLRRRAVRLGHAGVAAARRRVPAARATAVSLPELLDARWYLRVNADVAAAGLDAATHYRHWGWAEGRLPCPAVALVRALGLVDPGVVPFTMADVVAAGRDPVAHFCDAGWKDGRRPNLYFDTAWYLVAHDVPADMNPLLHYVLIGEPRGLAPSRHFDPAWYRAAHALPPGHSPLAHYLAHRRTQRVSPLQNFDVAAYVREHADTLRPGRDAYAHFLAYGAQNAASSSAIIAALPDLIAA